MDVRENITAGKYENKLSVKYEKVPVDEEKMTVRQAKEHILGEEALDRAHRQRRREEDGRLRLLFRADLEEEFALQNYPKREKLWDRTWDDGHSEGWESIYRHYSDLVELMT